MPEWVGFPAEMPGDTVKLKDNSINILLIRIEEERTMRLDERYYHRQQPVSNAPATITKSPPPIVLHLYVLLAARFSDYTTGLQRLSDIITFFQAHPVFPHETTSSGSELPELRLELHSPSFSVQNEMWGALKAPMHPSVLYKVSLVLLKDAEAATPATVRTVEPARIKTGDAPLTDQSLIKEEIVNRLP